MPTEVVLHLGKTHIGIEYYGPERMEELPEGRSFHLTTRVLDYSLSPDNFFDQVVGFRDAAADNRTPVIGFLEDFVLPTNAAFDELRSLGWNFAAQEMMMVLNASGFFVPEGKWARLVNAFFFAKDAHGLQTRHIKWIEFVPLTYDDSDLDTDKFTIDFRPFSRMIEHDLQYVYPMPSKHDFRYGKLPRINQFIELFGRSTTPEPAITSFLAEPDHQFILLMKFGARELHSELLCEWQSEARDAIRPDFFVVQPNGYADIIEFKLPNLKRSPVVGTTNRETLSAELASYVAQTRVYRAYFDDPNNRRWFRAKYGFDVYKPRRILVVGRRSDLTAEVWREIIDDFHDFEVLTYDDLVDGVVSQFYTN